MKNTAHVMAQLVVAACTCMGAGSMAQAATRSFEFSFDWDEGPLTGQVTSGRFSFDASLFHPTQFVQADQLFSQFSVKIDGWTFDETQAPGHYLRFHPDGKLRMMAVGNYCSPVTCYVDNPQDFAIAWDGGEIGYALYGHAPNLYSYAEVIHLVEISAVPEPGTWVMVLMSAPLMLSRLRRLRQDRCET